jgi:hypothetical protein
MSITLNPGRQEPIVARVDFDYTQLSNGHTVPAIQVPAGAVITHGGIVINTPWNSATTDTLGIGDAASPSRYHTAINAQATGYTALQPTGFPYSSMSQVAVSWIGTGATPTAGSATLWVEYLVIGRALFSEG